jgi:hypothetical protein
MISADNPMQEKNLLAWRLQGFAAASGQIFNHFIIHIRFVEKKLI